MSDSPEKHLLDDVMAEESTLGTREALLGHTLLLVRRKRHRKHVRQTACALAVFLALGLMGWWLLPSPSRAPSNLTHSAAKPYILVSTQPLPTSAIVETKPFSFSNIILSSGTVETIATAATYNLHSLDDAQLLRLVGPSSVILVRHGPHAAELMFANPTEREAFFKD